jgi:hypothetical protein
MMRSQRVQVSQGRISFPVRHISKKEADMSLPKLPVVTVILSSLWFAAALPAQTADAHSTSDKASKVRIVRLSEVKGEVQMDRAIGRGMETALANLPIVEQTRVQTAMGAAEVEFEDNSSLRVGPNSVVEFPKLERMPNGGTVSWVRVLKGSAYVSMLKSNSKDEFDLLFGAQKIALPASSHVRLEMGTGDAKLAVMDGALKLQSTTGEVDVTKKKTVTFNLATAGELTVDNHVASEPLDAWDKDSAGYHSRVAAVSAFNNSPYSYGTNDMMYYGSFMDAGACGTMWRPYFTSAAWDPYSNGSFAWYGENAGYSWVSPYPWGWTPYHSGSWSMCPGMGWGWQPGGGWNGINNMSMLPLQGGTSGIAGRPRAPGQPPAKGAPTFIPVSARPLVRSGLTSLDSFEFRKDSAGLGVPRDTLGKLNKISEHTVAHGSATTQVFISAPNGGGGMSGRAGAGTTAMLGATVHRGMPPPSFNAPSPSLSAGSSRGPGGNSATPVSPMPSSSSHPAAGSSGHPR